MRPFSTATWYRRAFSMAMAALEAMEESRSRSSRVKMPACQGAFLQVEGNAQDRAQPQDHDTLAKAEALVGLGVAGQDGFAFPGHPLDDAARNLKVRLVDDLLFQAAGHPEDQLPLRAVLLEHDKAALGPGGGDDFVHHPVEHLI
jgi:hypothetical protein